MEAALVVKTIADLPTAAALADWKATKAVHWGGRPQGAPLRCIVFTVIDAGRDYTHSAPDTLFIAQVQADILAETYSAAKAIEVAFVPAMEATGVVAGIAFLCALVDLDRDIPARDLDGGQQVFGRTLRLSIYYKEQS